MPLYEYRCAACHATVTRQESIEEHGRTPPPACPKCGGGAVEPVLSAFFAKTVRKS